MTPGGLQLRNLHFEGCHPRSRSGALAPGLLGSADSSDKWERALGFRVLRCRSNG
jgi:hypothetical protein